MEEHIREGFRRMARRYGPMLTNLATVKDVDEDAGTCNLLDEDGQIIPNVRLRPVLNENRAVLMVPKVQSQVLIIQIEDQDDWMVIGVDQVEKFLWITESASLEISDKISINANNKSMAELIDQLFEKIKAMSFSTPSGPTTALLNLVDFEVLQNDFKMLLK